MFIFAAWFFGGILAGIWADKRGRCGPLWIFVGWTMSPLLALLLIAVLPDVQGMKKMSRAEEIAERRHQELLQATREGAAKKG